MSNPLINSLGLGQAYQKPSQKPAQQQTDQRQFTDRLGRTQNVPVDRRSAPAVQFKLSADAVALLAREHAKSNGPKGPLPQQQSQSQQSQIDSLASPKAAKGSFDTYLSKTGNGSSTLAEGGTSPLQGQSGKPTRPLPPGSLINISV